MKSIANQYRDLKEGKMSQSNFMRNLRMMMPQHITNVTSFDDSIRILKNKGILIENVEPKDSEKETGEEEEILAMLDKIEQEKKGEEAVMSQYDPYEESLNETSPQDAKAVEDAIKSGKIKPEDVKAAAEKAMKGDSTDLALIMLNASADNLREAKAPKGSSGKEEYAKFTDLQKDNFQELTLGIQTEHEEFPEKSYDEVVKIVSKNIKKNPHYYTNYKLTGIRDYKMETMDKTNTPEVMAMKPVKDSNLVDKGRGMKKVKVVKEAMEVNPTGKLVNTPDEETFIKRLQQSTGLLQALAKINNQAELDGLFDAILNDTTINNISKQAIVSALRKVLDQMKTSNWSSSKVANKVFGSPQQQALSKAFKKGDFKEALKEMVRQELNEYEAGDESDEPPSKKSAAEQITDNMVDRLAGETDYKKKELEDVFSAFEDQVGKRYDDDVFEDVIDRLEKQGIKMTMKEMFDGRNNLVDMTDDTQD